MARKLTKAQQNALDRIRDRSLIVTHTCDGDQFSLDDGTAIHETIARNLIRAGAVRPVDDGLFPGDSQTFRVTA